MAPRPVRIQLRRAKGWRKPPNAIVVARPSRWGNLFRQGDPHPRTGDPMTREDAVDQYRRALLSYRHHGSDPTRRFLADEAIIREIQLELRGKDLACWCPLDEPCHADVLLEIANEFPDVRGTS